MATETTIRLGVLLLSDEILVQLEISFFFFFRGETVRVGIKLIPN
jgi:hypothetical protein